MQAYTNNMNVKEAMDLILKGELALTPDLCLRMPTLKKKILEEFTLKEVINSAKEVLTPKDYEDVLYKRILMPAFKNRYKLVRRVDKDFYRSKVGRVDLLSMALISYRFRKRLIDRPMTKEEVDEAYTKEPNAQEFYADGSIILSLAHCVKYPEDKKVPAVEDIEPDEDDDQDALYLDEEDRESDAPKEEKNVNYHKLNRRLMEWFDLFAKDAGLDPIYNAFDLKGKNPPIDTNACVKDWDGMKTSAILSAPIPPYELDLRLHNIQYISPELLDTFCEERKEYAQNRIDRYELGRQYGVDDKLFAKKNYPSR